MDTIMEYINLEPLNQLIERLPKGNTLANRFNLIKDAFGLGIKNIKPQIVLNLAKRINQRQKCHKQQQNLIWAFGQLKVFTCVAIYQSIATDKDIRQFGSNDICLINSIFCSKSNLFIQYQIHVLVNLHRSASKHWSEQELSCLSLSVDEVLSIIDQKRQEDKINWKAVSFRMFQRSNRRFFHDLNHCRQMWNNHIDPRVSKQQWNIEQDIRLFNLIIQYGTRWAKIAKQFNHTRTEHMVKNRYNRFFKSWKKNGDIERQLTSDSLHLKFSKAHLKRLEAKKIISVCDQSDDTLKTLKIQDEKEQRVYSFEALIQEKSVGCYEQDHQTPKENDYLQIKQEEKPSSVKEQLVKIIEQILPQQRIDNSIHQPKIIKQEDYQQQFPLYPQITQQKFEGLSKQKWEYYPFLRLYLPLGSHNYSSFA